MKNSENLSATSSDKPVQLPLKGFHIEVKSNRQNWRHLIEGMGEGRFRIHMLPIKK